jgi:lambda repressor-like predicted transcriptional regulator
MITRACQRLLAALNERGALSAQEIAQYAFIATTTLSGGYLKQLRDAEQIHIAGWRKASNGFSTPLYKAGPGIDQAKPKFKAVDRDSMGMAKIVAALKRVGPLTYRQIALATGLSHNTIRNARYMDALLEQKRVHIIDWYRNKNGPMAAVYADGRGRNAPPPEPLSRNEINDRQRMKQRLRNQSPSIVGQLLAA